MYYAFINNEIIDGCGQCPCSGENLFSVEITEEVYNNIDHYIWDGENIVINPNWDAEQLAKAKEDKLKENETIRDEFLVSGVIYRDILWDSDIEQKLNISVQVANMSDEDTVTWVAMDGVTSLECSKEDLLNIGKLLTTMTAYVWQYKNPEIKTAIANAQTLEELEAIEIVYSLGEIIESNVDLDNIEETEEL